VNNRTDERRAGMLRVEAWPADSRDVQLVTIRNLSKRGLSARLACAAIVGEDWTFDLPGLGKISGTIAWANSHHVGVRLQTEIDAQHVFEAAIGLADNRPTYAEAILSHVGQGKRPGLRTRT
jgi:hypothetical protein